MRIRFRKYLIASALGLSAAGSLVVGITMTATPATRSLFGSTKAGSIPCVGSPP